MVESAGEEVLASCSAFMHICFDMHLPLLFSEASSGGPLPAGHACTVDAIGLG